jgi:hypothetical protein
VRKKRSRPGRERERGRKGERERGGDERRRKRVVAAHAVQTEMGVIGIASSRIERGPEDSRRKPRKALQDVRGARPTCQSEAHMSAPVIFSQIGRLERRT